MTDESKIVHEMTVRSHLQNKHPGIDYDIYVSLLEKRGFQILPGGVPS